MILAIGLLKRVTRFLPFMQARKYVKILKLKSIAEWRDYCKSGKKPTNIPSNPDKKYKDQGWISFGDWLGTNRIAHNKKKFLQFEKAREFVHGLNLKSVSEWNQYCKSGKKLENLPYSPNREYRHKGWISWSDWLGTDTVAPQKKEYRSFAQARIYARSLGLESQSAWFKYARSKVLPLDIPIAPNQVYKDNGWKSWGDWIGTARIATQNIKFRPFENARAFARTLKLKNQKEWQLYCKSGKKPSDIPQKPERTYKNKGWISYGDWLGSFTVAAQLRDYMSFENARAFAHELNMKSKEEWIDYCKSSKKPDEIPANPNEVYKNEWKGMPDWLGYEENRWSLSRIKELLRSLIDSGIIYQWKEARLYGLLLTKGLLNLNDNNRHKQFFRNLMDAIKTEEGVKAVRDYAYSNDEEVPDLLGTTYSENDNVQIASSDEVSNLVNADEDPLQYERVPTVKQILSNSSILESINVDEEAMKFFVYSSVDDLWKRAFIDGKKTALEVQTEGKNGNKYHDTVIDIFMDDYLTLEGIKGKIAKGYSFPSQPTMMQLFVAHKVNAVRHFGNFSGTGAGKTLSAILASRVTDSMLTVIVCPNDVVQQWGKHILEIYPDASVITGKEAFNARYSQLKHQYLILNYDKFSQPESSDMILKVVKQKIDFVILDEVHFVKKRDEDSSLRRKNLSALVSYVRDRNKNLRVLALSATPVINSLMEGRSLLELITGKVYDDLAVTPSIPNAVALYKKLTTVSIREIPQYGIDINTIYTDVRAEKPQGVIVRHLKSNPLSIEQFLTNARIPKILENINGQTIIYTEYVREIISQLSNALKKAGYRYGLYTGMDRSGLSSFLNKKIQVLIASRPISVGVDGLQHICNRLIINTLPWTNAQYQQLIGRLVRKGQLRDHVNVFIIKASIGGYPYDELKWKRIQFKRTLSDCAIDGRLPEKNLVTPQQAALEAVKWLERLERGEVSTVMRRDLSVTLTPSQIHKRVQIYGDFTILNNRINNENSETTHMRMLDEPQEWEEYHRQYREARKTWTIIPYEEIIKRIKTLSLRLQIGDFGCGEAKIMEEVGASRVSSFDHIQVNNKVISCDMKSVPLPDEALDIAVFSLSLMGRNWPQYLSEANRCLAINGYLLIAETTKSLEGRLAELRKIVIVNGFEIYSDEKRGDFTFIEARKL
jgi:superfamily II DNA or RNA helicase